MKIGVVLKDVYLAIANTFVLYAWVGVELKKPENQVCMEDIEQD